MTLWERLWDRWALVLILSPFLFGGLFGFYVITVRPLTRALLARHWAELPCTIDSTSVRVIRGDDGDTHEVKISYHYVFGEATHVSERYDLSPMGGLKEKDLGRYPRGSKTTCYVNPRDPEMAVISRQWPEGALFGVFPLLAAALAAVFVWAIVRR